MSHLRPSRSDRAAGGELGEAPNGGVERAVEPDLGQGQAMAGEQDREQAPGQAVVEVVHQSGLRRRRQGRFCDAGVGEDLRGGQVAVWGSRLVPGMTPGFLDGEGGQAEGGVGDAEQERCGA
jgi:hypothetical protein